MLPIIKPELFDNIFYTVKAINNPTSTMSYVDFQMSQPSISSNSSNNWTNWPTISPTILQKHIKVKTLRITLSPTFDENNIADIHYLYNFIKNEINKDYFKKITILGEKHRNNDTKFDLDVKKAQDVYRKITSTLFNAANIVAINGRIGPSQWFASNKETLNYILSNIYRPDLTYKDNQLIIATKPFVIDDLIEDNVILSGRKNAVEQTGVHCFILTDDIGNVQFTEINNTPNSYGKVLEMYYIIEDIGSQSHLQYFNINTRSLSYYRNKKLQKINKLNE